mgnify:CR=1 FL=1
MKLVTYTVEDSVTRLGVISRDGEWVFPLKPIGIDYKNMQELIREISDSELQLIDYTSVRDPLKVQEAAQLGEIRFLPPIQEPYQDIICLGLNYLDHAKESAQFHSEKGDKPITPPELSKQTVYFSKRVNRLTTSGDPIPSHSDIVKELDYECELAVIIRKDADHLKPEEVKDCIFGYAVLNDVSARDIQTGHGQWFFGKSLEGFAPMSTAILTADSVFYPPELAVRSYVNGELRQDSNTSLLIHSIDEIVSELSCGMVLKSGTIIATGTPAGVGMGFHPPKFLKPGDEVICEIDGIGLLKNTVR